ncbi:eukaryotic translation initiation factor 5-like [Panulirus ornatus]|uniref:eukaryotic translation initiation factor 5-like n=1 Tax=Panulirus ornatus TaxID=150431 RepID=UPI003A880222
MIDLTVGPTVASTGPTDDNEVRLRAFYNYCLYLKHNELLHPVRLSISRRLYNEADRLHIKNEAVLILAKLLLGRTAMKDLTAYRVHFLVFTYEPPCQWYFLGALEILIQKYTQHLLTKVPSILQKVYLIDLVDEEVFLEWADKESDEFVSKDMAGRIRKEAEPFLQWLREAEEDDGTLAQ